MCNDHDSGLTRRGLLGAGAFAASAALAGGLVTPAAAQSSDTAAAPNDISPDEAMRRLMDGNARYVENLARNRDMAAGR